LETPGDRDEGPAPALVVLAAGESRRLGTPKALAVLGGRTVLERLLEAGRAAAGAAPLVVVGAHARQLRRSAPPDVELVENADWRAGRTGGLRLAVARRPGLDLVIAPVDVPLVPAGVFEALVAEWGRAGRPPRGWLAPAASAPGRGGPDRLTLGPASGPPRRCRPRARCRATRLRARHPPAGAARALRADLDAAGGLRRRARRPRHARGPGPPRAPAVRPRSRRRPLSPAAPTGLRRRRPAPSPRSSGGRPALARPSKRSGDPLQRPRDAGR